MKNSLFTKLPFITGMKETIRSFVNPKEEDEFALRRAIIMARAMGHDVSNNGDIKSTDGPKIRNLPSLCARFRGDSTVRILVDAADTDARHLRLSERSSRLLRDSGRAYLLEE